MVSLKELQQALAARLTTGSKLDTGNILSDFDAEELKQSRETLVRKRLGQIASLLPKTRVALGDKYESLCRTFIDQHHFQGIRAIQLDAIHFAGWLQSHQFLERWTLELASFEGWRLKWQCSSFFVSARRFRTSLLNEPIDGQEPPISNSVWLAVRLGRWGVFRKL